MGIFISKNTKTKNQEKLFLAYSSPMLLLLNTNLKDLFNKIAQTGNLFL